MNTRRNKSTANPLHIPQKKQKSPQEEFGAEVNHDSAPSNEKQKSKNNQPPSERTAWN